MASHSVIIDPKELREFAAYLRKFNNDLADDSTRLYGQFRELGQTWRDPAYAKFSREFEQIMQNIKRFRQISDEVIPRLVHTAERAEAVHR